jgi:hypothetical protein
VLAASWALGVGQLISAPCWQRLPKVAPLLRPSERARSRLCRALNRAAQASVRRPAEGKHEVCAAMFLLGLPTFEARTSRLERHVAPGHIQSNALVQLSLGESDGNHSDARAAIMDEGTQNHVGGKECGTYLIVSMQRSASTTFCHDVSLIDGPKKTHCAFELFAGRHVQKHRQDQEWVRGHPKEYLRHEANESRTLADVCVWGFKLFDSQLTDVAQIVSEVDKCIIYRCARRALSLSCPLSPP